LYLLQRCHPAFHNSGQQADDELSASIVLIGALLAEGKQGEAKKEKEAARSLGNGTQNHFLRLQFELVSGRVLLNSRQPEAAGPLLRSVSRDAQRYGFTGLRFGIDLALAEFANKTNRNPEAQIEFGALQKLASSRGFGLIARKAIQESSLLAKQAGIA